MNEGMARFEQFMVTIPAAIVVAVCALLVVYRMIDGNLHVGAGLGALGLLIGILYLCVWPPHPAVPGVALVAIISLMVTFPFAEKQLEIIELREYDMERLQRAFTALEQKPDNPSAMFDAARWLHQNGFQQDAIAIGRTALTVLSTHKDEVRNTSLRDQFRAEEAMINRWTREPVVEHKSGTVHKCVACQTQNPPGSLFCSGCKRPYLLDKVRLIDPRSRFFGKLMVTWALVGGLTVGGAAIGLNLEGNMRYVALGGAVLVVGLLLAWLFKPASAAR